MVSLLCFPSFNAFLAFVSLPGKTVTMDRGEMITILSREGADGWLVRDSQGNEQRVPTMYIAEVQSTVRIQS